jgi:hypothetical protein
MSPAISIDELKRALIEPYRGEEKAERVWKYGNRSRADFAITVMRESYQVLQKA